MRRTLIAGGLVVAVIVSAPFLVPISGFIPELEQLASKKLGQPVEIAQLRLHLLPTPRVIALGIRIGNDSEAKLGRLEVVPALFSFLSGPRSIRLIRAERVELREAAVAIPASMPKSDGGEPLGIRRIELKGVQLQHAMIRLPEFDAEATLGAGMALQSARFTTRDGKLRVALTPEGTGAANVVSLDAHKWMLPAGPPLLFDNLSAAGTLKGTQLELSTIAGKLYGGALSASAHADWTKQWQVSGKAKLLAIELVPLQQALGKKAQLSGRLTTEVAFSARARSAEQLAGALAADAPFEVSGGAYHGMDLSRVTELTVGRLSSGGVTKFDELSGKLQVRGMRSRVNDLCIRSRALVAGGYVEIAPDQTLSGKLDVSVARTKGFVGVPVALAGTTAEPSVSLTRGAMIGAVVGTVLLPGIGTGLGASAGNVIEGRTGCN